MFLYNYTILTSELINSYAYPTRHKVGTRADTGRTHMTRQSNFFDTPGPCMYYDIECLVTIHPLRMHAGREINLYLRPSHTGRMHMVSVTVPVYQLHYTNDISEDNNLVLVCESLHALMW